MPARWSKGVGGGGFDGRGFRQTPAIRPAFISGRPHGLVYWLIPAEALGNLMDEGYITVQHAMSDTKWFLPSRVATDAFSGFRSVYEDFVRALAELGD